MSHPISPISSLRTPRRTVLHPESDRPASLTVIACEGDPSECYDPPNKEIPPSPAGPGPGDPDTLRTAAGSEPTADRKDRPADPRSEPIVARVREVLGALFGPAAFGPAPLAIPS